VGRSIDIYGGKDPRTLPRYSIAEAAQYVRVPFSTIRTWVSGRTGHASTNNAEPIIQLPSGARLLSFQNLVEVHILGSIRRYHGVPLQRVRKALRFVRKSLAQPHPLITARFETDGIDLFVRELGKLLNASQDGQVGIKEALQASLRRVEHDDDGLAARLFPFVRTGDSEEPKSIVVDPRVSFGRPVLAKTGIPANTVVSRLKAGESVESIANDYGITYEQVTDAIRCALPAAA
jgi:uncharacterized protein (DUF433 family)/DNA-binding transcriptional MerR regulator